MPSKKFTFTIIATAACFGASSALATGQANGENCSANAAQSTTAPIRPLHFSWLPDLPIHPVDCSPLDVTAPHILGARLHVCGKWWGQNVIEQAWNWLPEQVANNNCPSGWGSWTGLFQPSQGYLYLKWRYVDTNGGPGQPTASGGLPD